VTNPFSRTTVIVVVAIVAISLATAVGLTLFGDKLAEEKPSAGADSYSVSAIGHRGFVDILESLGIPIVKSRSNSGTKTGQGLLIIAEPNVPDEKAADRLKEIAQSAANVLIVLPKWYGEAGVGETWIEDALLLPREEIEQVLGTFGLSMGVTRYNYVPGAPPMEIEALGATKPKIRGPQVITGASESDLLAGDTDGALVIQHEMAAGRYIYVLADPDVMNNHGLREPANAAFIIGLVDRLRGEGPVIIDEVIHGYQQPPSLLRTLFRFPLVLATLQVLILAVFAVWAAIVRFGPLKRSPPPLAPGKDYLIRNTAALLHYGGHHAEALRRYLQQNVVAVRQALHAPTLHSTASTQWLERVRLLRGGEISLLDLERESYTADSPERCLQVAERVYRWRMEMLDESRHRT